MKIDEIEIRQCRRSAEGMRDSEMRDGNRSNLEYLVITARTDDGRSASTFGFAGRGAKLAAAAAETIMVPFFQGRDPHFTEQAWRDFRTVDRWWNLAPVYSYGPFDALCWLLCAQEAGVPLYQYLGAARDRVPTYCSSLTKPAPEDYAAEAAAVRDAGFKAYKLHPPGAWRLDMACHAAAREAVGEDFTLMTDPVAAYTLEEAVRVGRDLERLDYKWYEEPLADENFHGLRELTRMLDIPICGTEVLAKHPYSVAECITQRVVDIVRADVSWTGGVTGTIKTARLAEAFGVQCELHTTIYQPLELVNLHCAAAISNCEFFELLWPRPYFDFGLKESIRIEDGIAILPDGPGLGIDLDWALIDAETVAVS